MKPWLVLLLLIPLSPFASAQDAVQEIAADPVGDLQASTFVGGLVTTQPIPESRFHSVDLVGYYVEERPDTIHLELEAKSLQPSETAPFLEDGKYFLGFTHNDQPFIAILYFSYTDQVYTWGFLVKQDIEQGGFDFVTPLQPTVEGNRIMVDLDREDLTDTNGAAPYPSRTLTRFFAQSHLRSNDGIANVNNIPIGSQFDAVDNLPDNGPNAFELPIQLGLQQRGHASLISPNPMRASNGEATTFVYVLEATNDWDREDQYDITLENVPRDWEVTLQDPIVHLKAGETKQIPILVSIPFLHIHGEVKTFDVKMKSHWDESLGHAQLGIRFHEVPQPAGHHNQIWFHTQAFGAETALTGVGDLLFSASVASAYFNTLEDDENDQGIPVTAQYWGYGYHNGFDASVPQSLWRWQMFLQPGLEMGLDFDLESEGVAYFPFSTTLPLPGAVLTGELYHWGYDDATDAWTRTTITKFDTGAPQDLTGSQLFEFPFTIEPSVDKLPYLKDAFLGIDWNLTSSRPSLFTGLEAPTMQPGGSMTIPLFEYHDPVTEVFPDVGAARIHMITDVEKPVNPGNAVLFEGNLMNHQDTRDEFVLSYTGVHQDWVVMDMEPITLDPNQDATWQLLVQVPEDANAGDAADIVLTAKGTGDARALVRLVATVDDSTDIPDEGHLKIDEAQESPMPIALVLIALAAIALRRRK